MKRIPPQLIAELVEYLKAERDEFSRAFEEDPKCAPTGSRVICDPAPTDTDEDWLVFVPDSLRDAACEWLEAHGATHSDEQEVYPDGVCFRLGDLNPVLIWDHNVFYAWVAATYWAAKLNLRDKAERTRLFRALVDHVEPIDDLVL